MTAPATTAAPTTAATTDKAGPAPFPVDRFVAKFLDEPVGFSILRMDRTLWIWVGTATAGDATLPNLSVALQLGSSSTSASTLLGGTVSAIGEGIARRLATRLPGHQIFVSYALDEANDMLPAWVERQLRVRLVESSQP
ncbi:proteasome (prosome, macropain) assembly chaperone 4 [Blastocladiella emersonii ATCC 22665]|nr:proteasome (prosome, macropain) assembly chaperone 4 [Blastocladiella emersonii ATCC 22665]